MPRIDLIQVRRGTASEWTSANPVLAVGEYGFETDTLKSKIGDGSTAWNSLSYLAGGGTQDLQSVTDEGATTDNPITTQGIQETGTRAGGDYVGQLGDYDFSNNGTTVKVDDANALIELITNGGQVTVDTDLRIKNGAFISLANGSFVSTLQPTTLAGNRNYLLPDKDGTFAMLSDIGSVPTILTAYKMADETITFDDTLTDDTDLTISLEANSFYEINAFLVQNSGGSADFKTSFTIPSGASGYKSDVNNGSSTPSNLLTDVIEINGLAVNAVYRVQGFIETTTAGDISLSWAQKISSSQNTTLLKGSYLKLVKL